MANRYSVKIQSVATDGTNLFFEAAIFDGEHTYPTIYPVFPVNTSVAAVRAYFQTIADNQPVLDPDIAALINTTITGA